MTIFIPVLTPKISIYISCSEYLIFYMVFNMMMPKTLFLIGFSAWWCQKFYSLALLCLELGRLYFFPLLSSPVSLLSPGPRLPPSQSFIFVVWIWVAGCRRGPPGAAGCRRVPPGAAGRRRKVSPGVPPAADYPQLPALCNYVCVCMYVCMYSYPSQNTSHDYDMSQTQKNHGNIMLWLCILW